MGKPGARIIGFDPGTARTGFGLIERGESGKTPRAVTFGLITTPSSDDQPNRLVRLADEVSKIIKQSKPTAAAVERLYFATNAKTALNVAEARGVILLECARAGLPIGEYTPLQVKQAVTAYGQADKAQVATMVCKLLELTETPKPDDITDALAVALCHDAHRAMQRSS